MGLRISGGSLRGRPLRSPANRAVRPTSARVRESLFSILGQRLDGWRVLDLFSGAGTLGIEAGSRGAEQVVFVECDRSHVKLIHHNATLLDGVADCQVLQMDAHKALRKLRGAGGQFDLVLCDPPYGQELELRILEALAGESVGLLAPGATVVLESASEGEPLPESIGRLVREGKSRRYGSTELTIYREGALHP